jgi:hypothetical protein
MDMPSSKMGWLVSSSHTASAEGRAAGKMQEMNKKMQTQSFKEEDET